MTLIKMIRLFVVAEPRKSKPLETWEKKLLRDMYVYWPRPGLDPHYTKPAKNLNDEASERILYLMGRDRNIHESYPMLPEEDDIKYSIDPNAVIITTNNKNCILEDFLIVLFYFCYDCK